MPDPRNPDVNIVNGYGISLWRNMTIPFELQGYLDRRSRVITFTKTHKGAYTNEVEYVGTILVDVVGNCIIKGDYKSGTIVLKKEAGTLGLLDSKFSCLSFKPGLGSLFHQ